MDHLLKIVQDLVLSLILLHLAPHLGDDVFDFEVDVLHHGVEPLLGRLVVLLLLVVLLHLLIEVCVLEGAEEFPEVLDLLVRELHLLDLRL
eukprot:CAMPEP_0202978344 /NCGR_PEP_ID=MMETSP1396-20130829/84797_1 /ASSEMBLY_ACC=CAM_ASM_000872 /TAXON_ID= /ORGANISM="Pseudokeronopsis sp., Strain Brazil" /LENGTH=90 /DNA_ID=CAMNT_0049717281 /DNA_START=87 /DNA_END=359 /DNA_ORIENTATION=+